MNADEIINRLREYAKHCDGVHSCWNDTTLISAADLIESLQAQIAAEKRRADAAVEALNKISDYNGSLICRCNEILKIANEWRGPQEAGKGE